MNIFVLDKNPWIAATMHCDKHVPKMILESVQMISTTHNLLGGDSGISGPYKTTHKNHPCTIWVRESFGNYLWLLQLIDGLHAEYRLRFGNKDHLSYKKLKKVESLPDTVFPKQDITPFAKAMPDDLKKISDPIKAYREYYSTEKSRIAKWEKGREAPHWFSGGAGRA